MAKNELDLKTLGKTSVEEPKIVVPDKVNESVAKTNEAMSNAAATAALKAALDANSAMALSEAEKTYVIEKKRDMLNKCKNDDVVEFVGQKIYAQYFGLVYTFMYNTIPVTVKFDGSTQKFPRFVYNKIVEKINLVSEASTPKKVDVTLN